MNKTENKKLVYAPWEIKGFEPDHPGELLKDELIARGIPQKQFAEVIGMPYTMLNEILNGKRPITTETALKIEAALGIKAYIWIGLQNDYNLEMAQKDRGFIKLLKEISKAAAVFA